MKLAQSIEQYYFDHITLLPPDKQFHFASRLAGWIGDKRAFQALDDLRRYMIPKNKENIKQTLEQLLHQQPGGRRNAHELRKPYFQKYPLLWGVHLTLFRLRHLKFVYNVDASKEFFNLVSREELDQMTKSLIDDEDALRTLSTFAVNFFYLYKFILRGDKDFIKPEHFLEISDGYNKSNKIHLQLMVYLFAHCIIGESNFYTQTISSRNLSIYRQMLEILEKIIGNDFQSINLDNKLEFLVCCRICSYDSGLFNQVWEECSRSVSNDGHFLIDLHNKNAQEDRKSFEKSEHRNVLYIMSTSPYEPHSTLLT